MQNIRIEFKKLLITVCVFLFANFFVYYKILYPRVLNSGFYFLNVGQGDSELFISENNTKILTDAGPDRRISGELGNILSSPEKYIDVGIISHPQLDHFGGYLTALDYYNFGIFIWNGLEPQNYSREWSELKNKIKEKNIRLISLGAGSKIKFGSEYLDIFSPDSETFRKKDPNEAGLIQKITGFSGTALFTADIGSKTEKYLLSLGIDLRADILKIGHHGSKFSSNSEFLNFINPSLGAIEVGKNTYGHPTAIVLNELENLGIKMFRTDKSGTFYVRKNGNNLLVSENYGN